MNKKDLQNPSDFYGIIAKSSRMQKIFEMIKKIANTNSTVLITGESGTGKELIAKAIHNESQRSQMGKLITVNCSAIPKTLLESEFFGYEKGAFTDAKSAKIGRVECANRGTLFLDEIGDMDLNLQSKLLRVIQEKTVERVGGTRSIKVDVRIIAATNKNLTESVKKQEFREDLFYRLNVIPIHVPPLNLRKGDIILLCNFFLEKIAKRNKEDSKQIAKKSIQLLENYSWPGNVRELENLMERFAILIEENNIEEKHIYDYLSEKNTNYDTDETSSNNLNFLDEGIGLKEELERYEKDIIINALDKTKWVKSNTAKLLKINRTTLIEKIKKLEIQSNKK